MTQYLKMVKDLVVKFNRCVIQQTPGEENSRADTLSKFGAMVVGLRERKITLVIKDKASIDESEVLQCVTEDKSWKSEIEEYLMRGTERDDPIIAKKLKFRANRFTMMNGGLYRRSAEGPLLKCLSPEKAHYILREIHEGSCCNQLRSLAQKVIRQVYFRPILVKDAMEFAKKCGSC
ncbi:UNVERIFIED_CONTAM: hypothetical protein Slati_2908700 [Sesamum latifolium]|uniref:Uncharacterized protein n=1 Tax=Sesamum latifolium TaxID=2727402 RepID=A0AAW2VCS4_9LAMI